MHVGEGHLSPIIKPRAKSPDPLSATPTHLEPLMGAIAPPSTIESLTLTPPTPADNRNFDWLSAWTSLQDAITAITDSKEIQAIGGEGVEAGTPVGKLILPEFDSANPKDIAKATYVPEDLVSLFGVETTASASTSAAPKFTQTAYVERSKNLLTALQISLPNSISIISFKDLVDSITANSHNGNIVTFLGLLYNSATPELQSVIEDSLLTGKLVGTAFTLDLYQDNGTTSFLLKDLGEKFKTLPSQLQTKLYQRWMLTEIMAAKPDSGMEGYLTKTYKSYGGGTDNFNQEGFQVAMQKEIDFIEQIIVETLPKTPSASGKESIQAKQLYEAAIGYATTINRTVPPHNFFPDLNLDQTADINALFKLFEVKTSEQQAPVTDPQSAAIAISQKIEANINKKREALSIDQTVLPPGFQVKLEILKDLEKSSLSRPAASSSANAAPTEEAVPREPVSMPILNPAPSPLESTPTTVEASLVGAQTTPVMDSTIEGLLPPIVLRNAFTVAESFMPSLDGPPHTKLRRNSISDSTTSKAFDEADEIERPSSSLFESETMVEAFVAEIPPGEEPEKEVSLTTSPISFHKPPEGLDPLAKASFFVESLPKKSLNSGKLSENTDFLEDTASPHLLDNIPPPPRPEIPPLPSRPETPSSSPSKKLLGVRTGFFRSHSSSPDLTKLTEPLLFNPIPEQTLAVPTVGASLADAQTLLASTPTAAPRKENISLLGTSSPSPATAATTGESSLSVSPPSPLAATTVEETVPATLPPLVPATLSFASATPTEETVPATLPPLGTTTPSSASETSTEKAIPREPVPYVFFPTEPSLPGVNVPEKAITTASSTDAPTTPPTPPPIVDTSPETIPDEDEPLSPPPTQTLKDRIASLRLNGSAKALEFETAAAFALEELEAKKDLENKPGRPYLTKEAAEAALEEDLGTLTGFDRHSLRISSLNMELGSTSAAPSENESLIADSPRPKPTMSKRHSISDFRPPITFIDPNEIERPMSVPPKLNTDEDEEEKTLYDSRTPSPDPDSATPDETAAPATPHEPPSLDEVPSQITDAEEIVSDEDNSESSEADNDSETDSIQNEGEAYPDLPEEDDDQAPRPPNPFALTTSNFDTGPLLPPSPFRPPPLSSSPLAQFHTERRTGTSVPFSLTPIRPTPVLPPTSGSSSARPSTMPIDPSSLHLNLSAIVPSINLLGGEGSPSSAPHTNLVELPGILSVQGDNARDPSDTSPLPTPSPTQPSPTSAPPLPTASPSASTSSPISSTAAPINAVEHEEEIEEEVEPVAEETRAAPSRIITEIPAAIKPALSGIELERETKKKEEQSIRSYLWLNITPPRNLIEKLKISATPLSLDSLLLVITKGNLEATVAKQFCIAFYQTCVQSNEVSELHLKILESFFNSRPDLKDLQQIFNLNLRIFLQNQNILRRCSPEVYLDLNTWQENPLANLPHENLDQLFNDLIDQIKVPSASIPLTQKTQRIPRVLLRSSASPISPRAPQSPRKISPFSNLLVLRQGNQKRALIIQFLDYPDFDALLLENGQIAVKFINLILMLAISSGDLEILARLNRINPQNILSQNIEKIDKENFVLLWSLFSEGTKFLSSKLTKENLTIQPILFPIGKTESFTAKLKKKLIKLNIYRQEAHPAPIRFDLQNTEAAIKLALAKDPPTNLQERRLAAFEQIQTVFNENFPDFNLETILDDLPTSCENIINYLKAHFNPAKIEVFWQITYFGWLLHKAPDSQFLQNAAMPKDIYTLLTPQEQVDPNQKTNLLINTIKIMIQPKDSGGIFGGSPFADFQIPMLKTFFATAESILLSYIHEPTGRGKTTLAKAIPLLQTNSQNKQVILVLPFTQHADDVGPGWRPFTATTGNTPGYYFIEASALTPALIAAMPQNALKIVDDYMSPDFEKKVTIPGHDLPISIRESLSNLKRVVFMSATPSLASLETKNLQDEIIKIQRKREEIKQVLTEVSATSPAIIEDTLAIDRTKDFFTLPQITAYLNENPNIYLVTRWLDKNTHQLTKGKTYVFCKIGETLYFKPYEEFDIRQNPENRKFVCLRTNGRKKKRSSASTNFSYLPKSNSCQFCYFI
ncbi:MAG: hypothetical protein WC860_00035 [Candidatus Margulisiibacteriota bacterium]|jgi:hypothetical protein